MHGALRARAALQSCLGVGLALLHTSHACASPAQDYMLHCMGCHGSNAQGVAGKVPPLAGSLAQFMRTAAGRQYVLRVPGAANSMLDDAQLAAVLNWVAQRFDGGAPTANLVPFTPNEVTASRHAPMASVQETRAAVVKELAASGPAPASHY
jgi:cytochrome c553